jgi:hypothetical protein
MPIETGVGFPTVWATTQYRSVNLSRVARCSGVASLQAAVAFRVTTAASGSER